jgi:hypothetical protein
MGLAIQRAHDVRPAGSMFVTNPFPPLCFSGILFPLEKHMQVIRLTLYIAAVASASAAQPEFEVASVKPAAPVTGHFQ